MVEKVETLVGSAVFNDSGGDFPGDIRTYERDTLGRVKTLQSGVKTQHHYDNLVRLDETAWAVNGEVFKVSTTYDALDRPDTVAYPGA